MENQSAVSSPTVFPAVTLSVLLRFVLGLPLLLLPHPDRVLAVFVLHAFVECLERISHIQ